MSAEEGAVPRSEDSADRRLHLVVADEPADPAIAEVAAEIRCLAGRAELEFTCSVGRLIVERFYGGNRSAWRNHASGKAASFRRLAAMLRDDCKLSVTALWRCVAIHDLVERLGGVVTWQHLSVTHLRAVLALPEHDQRRLLDASIEHGWTSRQLESVVGGEAPAPADRRQPPAFVAAIRRIERVVVEQDLALKDIGRARELGPKASQALFCRVMRIRERIDRLQNALYPKGLMAERRGTSR